jgi:hypothetical protein
MSLAEVLLAVFFAVPALPFDDVDRAGSGLSLLEVELCESDRAFSPLVDEADSLPDLKVLRSAGIFADVESYALGVCQATERSPNHVAPELEEHKAAAR